MKRTSQIIACFLASVQLSTAQHPSTEVRGKKMSYKTFNLENRKPDQPILVFEHGLGGGNFEQVFAFLPKEMAGIQYDRNGLGNSDADEGLVSGSDLNQRLRELLRKLEIQPPYLLVGHSIGGAYIRLFEAKYPDETAGLVFIDPTDFMLTSTEDQKAKDVSKSKTSYQQIWSINLKAMSETNDMPVGVRNEAKRELRNSSEQFFKEYQELPALKNIPVTVLISYNKPIEKYEEDMNRQLQLGIDIKPWWKAYDDLRIQHYSDLIRNNDKSNVVLLPKYSHGIHFQDPGLTARLIAETFGHCLKN